MINFDFIMDSATREATEIAAQRIANASDEESFSKNLDPETKELIDQNKINIIIMQELTKAALKHYHQALENEQRNKIRTSF